jgi:hypothetical protein
MRRSVVLAGALTLACMLGALLVTRAQQREGAVSATQAAWALRRVHAAVFPSFPLADVGCFTLRPGRSQSRVFVIDPSYTDYQTVHCEVAVRRGGAGYLVRVTQSWDDGARPTEDGPIGWVRRLLYKPPWHLWSYSVLPGGGVIVLPEQGARTPQSYAH